MSRDGAAKDLVGEFEIAAPREGFHAYLAVSELPMPAGLFLMASMRLGLCQNRLTVGDPGQFEIHLHAEAAFELRHRDFNVQLALAREQQLLCLVISSVFDRRIFLAKALQ